MRSNLKDFDEDGLGALTSSEPDPANYSRVTTDKTSRFTFGCTY
ncbi:hypothetical protein [Limosilactobacillus sp.]|nr:hypothetical protein [Limosilactobacillus sp.]